MEALEEGKDVRSERKIAAEDLRKDDRKMKKSVRAVSFELRPAMSMQSVDER